MKMMHQGTIGIEYKEEICWHSLIFVIKVSLEIFTILLLMLVLQKKLSTHAFKCAFKCDSSSAVKYLWKCAMEQKFFFT